MSNKKPLSVSDLPVSDSKQVQVNYNTKRDTNPEWVETLLNHKFFEVCDEHRELHKREINIFCIDCGLCFCSHCFSLSSHSLHRHLRIRRSMYQSVVNVDDLHSLFDCSKIQISDEALNNDSSPTSHLGREAEEAFPSSSSCSLVNETKRPEWVSALLKDPFFEVCPKHEAQRDSKINMFCIDCDLCFCNLCFSLSHLRHRHLQIRRNGYHSVVNVNDIHKHFDCSKIQAYVINSKRAVYLNPKVSNSNGGGGGSSPRCTISEEGVNNNDTSPTSHLGSVAAGETSPSHERGVHATDGSDEGTLMRPTKRIKRRRKGIPHRAPPF
ncbi:hypothetical protein QJS04_geneDACA017187 [Acorus gramineus]|uniref:B box-type domain-containing protein n=1 Tax=Acorus gramineus TaxID=55184 RepID=A0AAV9BLC7_ACOGR|nr:hypothetical protein QJS04_geneDACA017187 [Acorus gramineus]